MKLTVDVSDQLFDQASELTSIRDEENLITIALEALIEKHGGTVPVTDTAATTSAPEENTQPEASNDAGDSHEPTASIQFFGEFLVAGKVIDDQQLQEALNLVETKHVKVGQLAIKAGYITTEQTEDINRRQRDVDLPFGAIAVERGLLTQHQLVELLEQQKQMRLRIGEALVDLGHADAETIEENFFQFKKQQDAAQSDSNIAGDEFATRLSEVLRETFPTITIRVAGIKLKVDRGHPVTPHHMWDCSASLNLQGPQTFKMILTVNEDFADAVLRKIFGEELAESEFSPSYEDAIEEYLTIAAAGVVRSLATEGTQVKMDRPVFDVEAPKSGFAFPLVTADGNGTIILTQELSSEDTSEQTEDG